MFENIAKFFKKFGKNVVNNTNNSKDAAKERLHLVLMQDRANVSADFLELMKQEIIEVIKKYIDVDERAIDVRLTNKDNGDGTTGAPALYANIPIKNIKNEARKVEIKKENEQEKNIEEEIEIAENENEEERVNQQENDKIKETDKKNISEEKKDTEKEKNKISEEKETIKKEKHQNIIKETKEKVKSEK